MSWTPEQEMMMICNEKRWPGETLCVKKRPTKPNEKIGVMGYTAFGILTTSHLPLVVYLRPNFISSMQYDSAKAMVDDGWIVD